MSALLAYRLLVAPGVNVFRPAHGALITSEYHGEYGNYCDD